MHALTRNRERLAALASDGVHAIEGMLDDDAWHESIPRDVDCVLNSVSAAGGGVPGYWKSYVEGMRGILRWAAAASGDASLRHATFVYTGSTSVYGAADGAVVDEQGALASTETAVPLLEAERLATSTEVFGRRFVLRLAGIYGPGRHHVLDQLVDGAELLSGTGRHRLNLVHLDDIVSAVFACFDAPSEISDGIFNVCGDSAEPKEELVRWLCARLGRKPPQFAQDAGISEPTPGARRGRSGPVPDRIVSNERIRRTLGWAPMHADFRSGYEDIFARDGASATHPRDLG
ncbi:SDR family oxidoreductase [Opitutales bacterium ASA1]|nr:SDR family oxidoreductase [Opitutales bacterium ASA1]